MSSFSIRQLIEAFPLPVFIKNQQGVYTECNQLFEELIGLERSQIIGKSVENIAPAPLAELYRERDDTLMAEGVPVEYPFQIRDGLAWNRSVIFRKARLTAESGDAIGLVCVITDVTGYDQQIEELRRRESELTGLLDSLPGLTFLKNMEGRYLAANDGYCALMGVRRGQLIGKTDFDVADNLFALYQFDSDRKVIDTKMPRDLPEWEWVSPRGVTVTLIGRKVPLYDESGAVSGIAGTMLDVSGMKQAQKRIKRPEALYHAVFHSAHEGILVVNASDYQIEEANPAVLQMFGYQGCEIARVGLDMLLIAELGEMASRRLERIPDNTEDSFQWAGVSKTGTVFPVRLRAMRTQIGFQRFYILNLVENQREREAAEKAARVGSPFMPPDRSL